MRWLVLQRHDMVPHRRRGPIIARSFTTFPDTPTEKHLLRLLMPHVHALFERWRMGDFCCLTSLPVKCVRIRPNITEVCNYDARGWCIQRMTFLVGSAYSRVSLVFCKFLQRTNGITRAATSTPCSGEETRVAF